MVFSGVVQDEKFLECFNDWTVCVQSRQQTPIVYIYFGKAFDVVLHKKVIRKIIDIRHPWDSIIVDKKFFHWTHAPNQSWATFL